MHAAHTFVMVKMMESRPEAAARLIVHRNLELLLLSFKSASFLEYESTSGEAEGVGIWV